MNFRKPAFLIVMYHCQNTFRSYLKGSCDDSSQSLDFVVSLLSSNKTRNKTAESDTLFLSHRSVWSSRSSNSSSQSPSPHTFSGNTVLQLLHGSHCNSLEVPQLNAT